MITMIIIVSLAFLWLGIESKWLTIDLMGQSDPMVTVARAMLCLPAPKHTRHTAHTVGTQYSVMVTPAPAIPKLLDTVHFKPSTFQPLAMPVTTSGTEVLNIICRRVRCQSSTLKYNYQAKMVTHS